MRNFGCLILILTCSASCELGRVEGQEESYEYESQKKRIIWRCKLRGGQKAHIKIKLNLDDVAGNHKKEIGPISYDASHWSS